MSKQRMMAKILELRQPKTIPYRQYNRYSLPEDTDLAKKWFVPATFRVTP
jgi:hypothetical protein